MDICHLKKAVLDAKHRKYKGPGSSCTPRWYCKKRFGVFYSIHWIRNISISNNSRESHAHHIKTSRMFRTSSRCSIRVFTGQNARCINVIKNFKVRMSRYLSTSTEAKIAQNMMQYGRPSCSSWKESTSSSCGRTLLVTAIWKVLLEYGWEKVLNWECLFVNREKGLFLSVYVDAIKLIDKTYNTESTCKNSHERRWSERTNIISWPRIFGMHSKRECKISMKLWQATKICSNPGFLVESRKNYL